MHYFQIHFWTGWLYKLGHKLRHSLYLPLCPIFHLVPPPLSPLLLQVHQSLLPFGLALSRLFQPYKVFFWEVRGLCEHLVSACHSQVSSGQDKSMLHLFLIFSSLIFSRLSIPCSSANANPDGMLGHQAETDFVPGKLGHYSHPTLQSSGCFSLVFLFVFPHV